MRAWAVGHGLVGVLALTACTEEPADERDGRLAADVGAGGGAGAGGDAAPEEGPRPPTACPDEPPSIDTCFRGFAFADCGGDGEPVRYCAAGASPLDVSCLWFTGGCPAAGFPERCLPAPEPAWPHERCPVGRASIDHGTAPWTRERAMHLDLRVDPALTADGAHVACAGDCRADPAPTSWRDGVCHPYLMACDGERPGWPAPAWSPTPTTTSSGRRRARSARTRASWSSTARPPRSRRPPRSAGASTCASRRSRRSRTGRRS